MKEVSEYFFCIPERNKNIRLSNRDTIALVGGKGANLVELSTIEDVNVPEGFCITTKLYKEIIEADNAFNALIDQLATLKPDERKSISTICHRLRQDIESISIPENVEDEIANYLAKFGEQNAYAVRSSATAEDLPDASFAGQQDTYLNITGREAILKHIKKCWASLFTDRAVIYRMQNGFDQRKVQLSVIVQKMIFPDVSGILFTADPVSSNRKTSSIDASFGLGEALVSGRVNADNYKVQNGKIAGKKISVKKIAVCPMQGGGTEEKEIDHNLQGTQALTDEQIVKLEQIGRRIEKHFDCPQDIEWCLSNNVFYIVQSRAITTLYPTPKVNDQGNHVYVSVGHQQMMTDAMKPLGLSLWQLTASAPMHTAGGRLFVDITPHLASSAGREMMIGVLGKSDPLIRDALTTLLKRKDFIKPLQAESPSADINKTRPLPNYSALHEYDSSVVSDLIARSQASIAALKQTIQKKSGPALIDFILQDFQELKKIISDSQSFGVIMTAMNASSWINEKMQVWLNEKSPADILSQSLSNNATSEMGLALLDVADVIRPWPEVIAYLQHTKDENFLDELPRFKGGKETQDAINHYLDTYGMRCPGEIDITRTRWSEKPTMLLPLILNNIKNFARNESKRRFEQGLQEAVTKEKELLRRLRELPDGEQKAKETKRMINLIRNLAGYREYPKYHIVSRYFIYKQALLKEADTLVHDDVIYEREDIYYLTFEELQQAIRTRNLNYEITHQRKREHKRYEKLSPPRIITSDGEIINGQYKRENLPADAIVGLPVSSGVIEGRARVILNMEDADLEDGDILVTPFTDPGWTPLFISIKGLITEVGGLMTHGAVIAREYGLPAVVGVENATKLIKDKQQIRLHGTEGYIELL